MITLANVITKLKVHNVTALSDMFACSYSYKNTNIRNAICMRVLEEGIEYIVITDCNINHPGRETYMLRAEGFKVTELQERITINSKAEHLQYSHIIEWLTSYFKAYKTIML